jgi:hypothetical protein
MFDISLMDKFRDPETSTDEDDVAVEVRNAWYMFINDFCTAVSFHWANYLKRVDNNENATFISRLTASDEALAMWIITVKFNEVNDHAQFIREHGDEEWRKKKAKRKSGSHASKSRLQEFITLHKRVMDRRSDASSNILWERMFFDTFLADRDEAESPEKTVNSASEHDVSQFLTMDDDEELEM